MKEFGGQINIGRLTMKAQERYSNAMPQSGRSENTMAETAKGEVRISTASPHAKVSHPENLEGYFRNSGVDVFNTDIKQTIRLMNEAGIKPQDLEKQMSGNEAGNDLSTEKRREVMINASLDDRERVDKAVQLLKRNLKDKEKEALLGAHNQGKGETGKDGNDAGVYNYTEGQILRKAKILSEAGFSKEDRRVLMEAGLVGNPIDATGITDPKIAAEMQTMNIGLDIEVQPTLNTLLDALNNISRLTEVNPAEKQLAIARIRERLVRENEAVKKEQGRMREDEIKAREENDMTYRFSYSLMKEEMKALMSNPEVWLNGQFDQVYALAEGGQELNSPLIQNTQNKIAYAIDLVKASNPENLKPLIDMSTVRLHLLQMRTAIGYKDMEQVKGAAAQLRAHGLLFGMQLENGRVGEMFNRFQDKLEETRLWSNQRHHVMLEDVLKTQNDLINEQMNLARKGKGNFGNLKNFKDAKDYMFAADEKMTDLRIEKEIKENKKKQQDQDESVRNKATDDLNRLERIKRIKQVNADITRTVRTAYDVFVSSQRMGVIVSRGKYLVDKSSSYRSDPIGPLTCYNMEDLTFDRFDMYSAEQEEFVARIKLDMAENYLKRMNVSKKDRENMSEEEKIAIGKGLFRDIFAVPDYFSSGWRIEGVVQALEQRIGKDKAGDFALFMRLRLTGQDQYVKSDTERREIFAKIWEFRPEEIIRLFRERKNMRVRDLYSQMIKIDGGLALTSEEESANQNGEVGRNRDLTTYDKFKQKYGAVIGLLRQEGYNRKKDGSWSPIQINLSALDDEQKKTVNEILGADGAQKLMDLSKAMQDYIKDPKTGRSILINDLLTDNKFADVYTRSIIIDDALLDKIEDEKPDVAGKEGVSKVGYIPFSRLVGEAGAGNDTLTRSYKDTDNAIKAGNTLIKFIKEENLEKKTQAALEFASLASEYNGLGAKGQAECVRYTIGTYMNLSKTSLVWDVIGVDSLPFRIPASEAQKIFGIQADATGRDELRTQLDHLRGFLATSISKKREAMNEQIRQIEQQMGEKGSLTSKQKEDAEKFLPEEDKKKAEQMNLSKDEYIKKHYNDEGIKNFYIAGLKRKLHEDEEESQRFYEDMEHELEVTTGDYLKRTGLRLLLYLLLVAVGEGYQTVKAATKDSK
jgi:hypothetical protein